MSLLIMFGLCESSMFSFQFIKFTEKFSVISGGSAKVLVSWSNIILNYDKFVMNVLDMGESFIVCYGKGTFGTSDDS